MIMWGDIPGDEQLLSRQQCLMQFHQQMVLCLYITWRMECNLLFLKTVYNNFVFFMFVSLCASHANNLQVGQVSIVNGSEKLYPW